MLCSVCILCKRICANTTKHVTQMHFYKYLFSSLFLILAASRLISFVFVSIKPKRAADIYTDNGYIDAVVAPLRRNAFAGIMVGENNANNGVEKSAQTTISNAFLEKSSTTTGDCEKGYALAKKESLNFFTDIDAERWQRKKDIHVAQLKVQGDNGRHGFKTAGQWYQENWEPSFNCDNERRIGPSGDGGKWVCDPFRIGKKRSVKTIVSSNDVSPSYSSASSPSLSSSALPSSYDNNVKKSEKSCLVYSIGSDNDFRFEEAVLRDINKDCEIHVFDPTIGFAPSNTPQIPNVHFHPWGLSDRQKVETHRFLYVIKNGWSIVRSFLFNSNILGYYATDKVNQVDYKMSWRDRVQKVELYPLEVIKQKLGHTDREIDILKIDCEGCEYDVVDSIFPKEVNVKGRIHVPIRQILIEVHRGTYGFYPPADKFFRKATQRGFAIFHKEPNIHYATYGSDKGMGGALEFGLVKLGKEMFEGDLNFEFPT